MAYQADVPPWLGSFGLNSIRIGSLWHILALNENCAVSMKAYLYVWFKTEIFKIFKILPNISWKHICMSGSGRRKQGFCLNLRLKLFSRNLCESRPDCAIVNQRQEKLLSKRNCYIVGTPRQQWQREIFTLSTMINYKGLREKETK